MFNKLHFVLLALISSCILLIGLIIACRHAGTGNTILAKFWSSILRNFKLYLFAAPCMLVASTILMGTTCDMCFALNPTQVSSWFSRQSVRGYCNWDSICYSYLTVPQDMSTSMIFNFQYFGAKPKQGMVVVSHLLLAYAMLNQKEQIACTCFHVNVIVEEERYHCWCDLSDLMPSSAYTVQAYVNARNHSLVKFRTAPSLLDPYATITYVNGGDTQLEHSASGISLSLEAAKYEPLFAIVGGDISYENGMPACYRRWDVQQWQALMLTPQGYSIPILTCVGNHEAAGFKRTRSENAFYIRYFPHELNLQSVDPQNRKLQHSHQVSNHTIIIALDSHVHETPESQVVYLQSTLSNATTVRNKLVVYHAALYPSKTTEIMDIVMDLRKHWEPLFDKYHVTFGLENHFHSFKYTYPIRNGTKSTTGTVYLGDGAWGIESLSSFVQPSELFQQISPALHLYIMTSNATSTQFDALAYQKMQKQVTRIATGFN